MKTLLVVAFLAGLLVGMSVDPVTATGSRITRFAEDDPRFDCRTMGNLICGPQEVGQ